MVSFGKLGTAAASVGGMPSPSAALGVPSTSAGTVNDMVRVLFCMGWTLKLQDQVLEVQTVMLDVFVGEK